jgi:hypothetical protein
MTTRWVVDGRELDGVGFGFECVGLCDWTERLVLGVTGACVVGDAVRVGVGVLERARTAALDEHAAVAPRTHTTPATRAAKRSRPERLTRTP